MKHRIYAVAAVLALLLSGLTACGTLSPAPLQKFSTHSFDYFDTVTTVTGYAQSQEAFDRVAEQVLEQLQEYHLLYDIYKRYDGMENLCTVNDLVNDAHRTVTVDRRIIDLLLYAREMYDLTDGMTNIAMGSVLKLWHDCRTIAGEDPSKAALPDAAKLAEAGKHIDISALEIDKENCTVRLTDPLASIDVGAVGKGYATEMAAKYLEEQGKNGYILNVGGNIRIIGARPDGSPFKTAIKDPKDPDMQYAAIFALTDTSCVTSGVYERFFAVKGKQYHHVIDRDTLYPSEHFASVSVITRDSGLADALSTALFCMSYEEGLALVQELGNVDVLWIDHEGNLRYTDGLKDKFVN